MVELAIVGTGGMGREALAWLVDAGRADDVVGFLDDDVARHDSHVAGKTVLGGVDWLEDRPDVEVVLAVGSPAARRHLIDRLTGTLRFATVLHPSAVVGPRVSMGEGCIICPGVVLTCDVDIGRAVIVNYGGMLGHDCRVDDAAFIAPGVNLAGGVIVGAGAEIGIGASVIQGVRIGERAVIGAGSVVVRDVVADTTVAGVPARPIESA